MSCVQFPPSVVEWCLSCCVRHPHVELPAARRWTCGELVGATLRGLAGRADSAARDLLLACLTDEPSGGMFARLVPYIQSHCLPQSLGRQSPTFTILNMASHLCLLYQCIFISLVPILTVVHRTCYFQSY